ncbi:MAG: ATP-dependent RNA helicase [Parcubacteria group bacterium LiPW_41]|nr:MAG: ATP-dependent RNA helicase [Parcubacteria group bacterium LiPW_41]
MNRKEQGFHGFGIAPAIMEILTKLNFITPTPIQEQAIASLLQGKDVMGIAQTGTGKTLAFGIPLIQNAIQKKGTSLVIAPTRELALQIDEAISAIGKPLGIKTAVLIGGEPIGKQIRQLSRNPNIIIGTPGRIVDHTEQRTVSLQHVKILVLDEADRMLDMGFAPQLKRIHALLPKERQTMLFSATMPESIVSIARMYLSLPIRVEVAPQGSTAKDVTQEVFFVPHEDKPRLLEKVLQEYQGSVLVFARTKHGARKIALMVRGFGNPATEIHSNRSLNQRKEALQGFKNGTYRVLVATDIAARGIDVKNIELVINYDLPENAEDYVHRIGRTGRAGEVGRAISFARPDEKRDIRVIEQLISRELPVSKLPELPTAHPLHRIEQREERRPSFSRSRGPSRGHFQDERPRRSFGTPRSRTGQGSSRPRPFSSDRKPTTSVPSRNGGSGRSSAPSRNGVRRRFRP